MVSMSVSCCCFYSGKIRSPRTNYLSSTPMFSSPSFQNFLSFTLCLRSFWFIPSLFQISPLIKGIEIIFGDPGLLPPTFFPKDLTICLCHLCIVGGNHGTNVPVIIPQTDKLGWVGLLAFFSLTSGVVHSWCILSRVQPDGAHPSPGCIN